MKQLKQQYFGFWTIFQDCYLLDPVFHSFEVGVVMKTNFSQGQGSPPALYIWGVVPEQ